MAEPANMTIRPATLVDLDEVTELWARMAEQHAAYNPRRWNWRPDAPAQFGRYLCQALSRETTLALVAQPPRGEAADGELAGFLIGATGPAAGVLAAELRGEISDLYVRPDWRRRGVATALMARATEIMTRRGAAHVVLSVAQANDEARALYRKLGYETCVVQLYKQLT